MKSRKPFIAFWVTMMCSRISALRRWSWAILSAAEVLFAERGFRHLYLGTCYSQNALYKTQFAGAEFFNGFRWSDDLDELKFIIKRDKKELCQHLLETDAYREEFYGGDLEKIRAASEFRVKVK